MRSLSFLLLSLGGLAACSSYNPDLGGAPYLCADAEPKCPEGYTCQDDGTGRNVCFSANGMIVDAAPVGFQCADDSAIEHANGASNDTIQTAYPAPMQPMSAFAGLAICPEGDKDHFLVNITVANQNLEVTTSWDSGMPVSVSILNGGGTSINNGTSSGANMLRAYAANLPIGSYYAQAYGSATTKNNYRLAIKVTGP